jgi:hypothetical protein
MISCPSCGSAVTELVACDTCNRVGCVRCVVRSGKQWTCNECKTGIRTVETKAKNADGLFSMFG